MEYGVTDDFCYNITQDPVHRRWHHNRITFSMLYAFTEHFVLPFSHDEVVHGKKAMLDKMPGDLWRKHATLRALYTFIGDSYAGDTNGQGIDGVWFVAKP